MQRLGVYFGLKLLKGIRNRKKMGWESWSIHEAYVNSKFMVMLVVFLNIHPIMSIMLFDLELCW